MHKEIKGDHMSEPQPTFSVFIEDDVSYCVLNGSAEFRHNVACGRELIWDQAPTQLAGWARAVIERGCLPQDYDDPMWPVAFSSPRKLYRSVSFHELVDIIETGEVRGGSSRFNELEKRPFVFFSSEPTEQCIGQGWVRERTAIHRVLQHFDVATYENDRLANEAFKTLVRAEISALNAIIDPLPHTHAVLETKPVGPGLHYSREHGSTAMNGEDEFALFPGQVTVGDIVAVHWARQFELAGTSSMEEAAERLADYGLLANVPAMRR